MVLLIGLDFGWFQDKWIFWFFLWITDQSKTLRLSVVLLIGLDFGWFQDKWIFFGFFFG
jgi:hypothetical protein